MSSIPHPALVVTPTFQFKPSTGEMLHFVEENSNSVSIGSGKSPPPLVRKADLPRPPLASGVMRIPIPRPKKKAKTATATSIYASESILSLPTEDVPSATAEGTREMPPTPLATSLPELVKKFGQIKTMLQSPSPSSKFLFSKMLIKSSRIR
ncbi:TMV resistance protein N-like [Pyrus ussuriensis x Pyrus communis]|uniref:TMV resistance protein N-like n=1 Tax=Pyrus ussuriensis x Pyrus communis TaxID=2448454 RepID=A0A5N5FR92_9ROSA|nr:TMV resistance protein N-like [Pyrus ussuriensis x Pyrus communis]